MQSIGSTPIPERFSSVMGLGAPTALYPAKNSARWGYAIFGLLLLAGTALTVLYGIYEVIVQTDKHGPAVFQDTITPPACIAGLMFLFGAVLAFSAIQNWNRAVVLYEKGLAYTDRKGLQAWRWEEVSLFFIAITRHYSYGIRTGTTYVYTLRKMDGSQIRLDNAFAKIQELGGVVQQKVFPAQYERLAQALKNGQTVTLGTVGLNNQGLTIGKKNFPWTDVEQVGIQRGFVSIKKKDGGWFSGATASVASVPNLEAMLAVVDQIVKVKAG